MRYLTRQIKRRIQRRRAEKQMAIDRRCGYSVEDIAAIIQSHKENKWPWVTSEEMTIWLQEQIKP